MTVQDLTPTLAQAMNVNVASGAVVSQVVPQSAAAKAGVQEGDVITALDGEPITGSSQLRNAVGQRQPGTNVRLALLRDGKERSITVALNAQSANTAAATPVNPTDNGSPSGLTLAPIPRESPNFGKVSGVHVAKVQPGSMAEEAGIKEGDIILSAGRVRVSTPAELMRILRDQKKGTPLLLQIRRGNSALYTAIG